MTRNRSHRGKATATAGWDRPCERVSYRSGEIRNGAGCSINKEIFRMRGRPRVKGPSRERCANQGPPSRARGRGGLARSTDLLYLLSPSLPPPQSPPLLAPASYAASPRVTSYRLYLHTAPTARNTFDHRCLRPRRRARHVVGRQRWPGRRAHTVTAPCFLPALGALRARLLSSQAIMSSVPSEQELALCRPRVIWQLQRGSVMRGGCEQGVRYGLRLPTGRAPLSLPRAAPLPGSAGPAPRPVARS